MQDIRTLREQLDQIDRKLMELLAERMDTARQIGRWKMERGLPVLDAAREEQVLESRAAMVSDPEMQERVKTLFRDIMAMSRAEQEKILREEKNNA